MSFEFTQWQQLVVMAAVEKYLKQVRHFKNVNRGMDAVTELTEDDVIIEFLKLFQLKRYGKAFKEWFSGVESEYDFERNVAMAREELIY